MDILTDKNSELLTIINKLRTIKQDLKDMETFIPIRGEMMYLMFRPQLAQLEVRIYHFIRLIVLIEQKDLKKTLFFRKSLMPSKPSTEKLKLTLTITWTGHIRRPLTC